MARDCQGHQEDTARMAQLSVQGIERRFRLQQGPPAIQKGQEITLFADLANPVASLALGFLGVPVVNLFQTVHDAGDSGKLLIAGVLDAELLLIY